MQTTAIKATISTYSTSEAPSSSLIQFRQRSILFFHICASLSKGREVSCSPPFPSFSLSGRSPHRRVGRDIHSLLSSRIIAPGSSPVNQETAIWRLFNQGNEEPSGL